MICGAECGFLKPIFSILEALAGTVCIHKIIPALGLAVSASKNQDHYAKAGGTKASLSSENNNILLEFNCYSGNRYT